MSDVERITGQTYVWRADLRYRIAAAAAMALLLLLSVRVLKLYGFLAVVGVVLVLAVMARTWWVLLRPKLTAGPDGVQVVHGLAPVQLSWAQIRRCEPTAEGLKIVTKDGETVLARYPQQRTPAAGEPTEADATAAYLAQRAAWARKPTGAMPVYTPPSRAAKPARG